MTDDDYEDPMPKQKSKRALRKRVKLTGTGRLRRYHAYKSHILTKKHPKRKRHLRKATLVSHADERRLKRKNKVMKLAKGYFGGRSKLWKAAKESVERAQKYAYRDRRRKKGDFRRLWITRINAAARLHQLSYSRMMNGLRRAGVEVNRKVLADLAVRDPAAFGQLAEAAKRAL